MNDVTADRIERMNRFVKRMNAVERDLDRPDARRDAATLILVDRSGAVPKVLLGKRHARHKFMPGKFVFPGGRVEPADKRMPVASALDPHAEARLMQRFAAAEPGAGARARARGDPRDLRGNRPAARQARRRRRRCRTAPGRRSRRHKVLPDLGTLHFIGRAITPPGRPRRFDARFFTMDASAIAHRVEGVTGPDAELVELVWMPLAEAKQLDMPAVTGVMLEELEAPHRRRVRPRPAGAVLSDDRAAASCGNCCRRGDMRATRDSLTLRPQSVVSAATSEHSRGSPWRKPPPIKVKLVSSADTGFYYVTKKNSRTMTDKLVKKKYDPVAKKHVEFREAKIK